MTDTAFRPWAIPGAITISPTGMAHTIDTRDGLGWFTTVCGVQVAGHQDWDRPSKRPGFAEGYRHCSRCSIYGTIPKVVRV